MAFKFAKENKVDNRLSSDKWKVLIVDDDDEIHTVTKLALKKFVFENKTIEFYDAYNGSEAIELLKKDPSIDLVLLDVVMETDDDGLVTAQKIREELKNKNVRIVLRTGQPGNAPEHEVILNYDIDDYKEKTELTSTKLFTTIVTALRTSRYLKDIEKNKEGLAQIIESSKSIFKLSSLLNFTDGVLKQLGTILNLRQVSMFEYANIEVQNESDGFFATLKNNDFQALSASGKFKHDDETHIITPNSLSYLNKAYTEKRSFFQDDVYVGYFHSSELERTIFLYIEGCKDLSDNDRKFLEVFSNNISIAFENICLLDKNKEKNIILSHQTKLATMGEIVDNIAHQWKKPLSLITTNASGMKMMKEHNLLKDKEFFDYCDSIIEVSEYLSHTIEDFRGFFKSDRTKSYFKIHDVIKKVLFLLSAKLERNGIQLDTQIGDIEIFSFQNELIQVLINIINNSIDALCEVDGDKVIFIKVISLDDSVSIEIKDNAGGISQDIIEKIFEQYFSTKEDKHGTGIGLYMVKNIIEEHIGGSILVENQSFEYHDDIVKGACFRIEMKINVEEE